MQINTNTVYQDQEPRLNNDENPLRVTVYTLDQHNPYKLSIYDECLFANKLFEQIITDYGSRLDVSKTTVAFTYPLAKERNWIEKMGKVIFETYRFGGILCCTQSFSALHNLSNGTNYSTETALSVHVGNNFLEVCPMVNGYVNPSAFRTSQIAGNFVDEYWARLLMDDGHFFESKREMQIIRDMKEKHGYILPMGDKEYDESLRHNTKKLTWDLNDGVEIDFSQFVSFVAPESIFRPAIYDRSKSTRGLSEMVFESIDECGSGSTTKLLENIYISGGSTKFRGFKERLQYELETKYSLSPTPIIPKVNDYTVEVNGVNEDIDRSLSVWKGLYNYASDPRTLYSVCTNSEYEEAGVNIFKKFYY